jgi:hypothetical protein
VDWDGNDTTINEINYRCSKTDLIEFETNKKRNSKFSINKPDITEFCRTSKMGNHLCLDKNITYKEKIPLGGPHRPVWVTYGDYLYMPPQRWIHAVEHGAAIFLFNPCNRQDQIDYLKNLVKGCLRRHIITPYRKVPINEFYIVTHGCRLKVNAELLYKHENDIVSYLRVNNFLKKMITIKINF